MQSPDTAKIAGANPASPTSSKVRETKKVCLQCGKKLSSKYQKKFCSRSCAATVNNSKRAPRSKAAVKWCLYCGEKIPARNSFCSRECFGKARRARPAEALVCSVCGRDYVYDRQQRKGHSKVRCNSCKTSAWRRNIKRNLVELLGGKCIQCGYNKCIKALEFHHPDGTKEFALGSSTVCNWERMKAEAQKCMLLCANCHREVHAELDEA